MTLEEAKQLVFTEKPVLAAIYGQYCKKTWLDYAKEQFPKTSMLGKQKNELLTAFEKLLIPLIGKEKTDRAAATLEKTGFVSTADHHGILWHPFFSNSALLRSHPSVLPAGDSTIVLSCGGISLNNSSYPRGIFFHDRHLREVRLNFASLHTHRRSVYGHPPLSRIKFELEVAKVDALDLSDTAKKQLHDFLQAVTQILQKKDRYSDELTSINDILWETLFGTQNGSLIYLEAESLIRTILLDIHLEKETLIHSILFNESCRNAYLKQYEGILGAHDTAQQKGTHLFWYIDEQEQVRKQLWIEGNSLTTADKTWSILLHPDTIRRHLERFELLPSMALCYSMLAFYYGLTLGGGFSQVQYLGSMKQAFASVCATWGDDSLISPRTDIFTGEYITMGLGNDHATVPATLIDILLWSGTDRTSIINRQLEISTVGESLDLMMPEFIRIITGKRETLMHLPNPPLTFHV